VEAVKMKRIAPGVYREKMTRAVDGEEFEVSVVRREDGQWYGVAEDFMTDVGDLFATKREAEAGIRWFMRTCGWVRLLGWCGGVHPDPEKKTA
jgi:hypothetical protein